MESYVNAFLKTELTVIPGLLNKYFGKYYNNVLCNGATWMVIAWCILHLIFDQLLNALLKRMKYKQYKRQRLQRSLWYLGFYTTACIYSIATLFRNDLKIVDMKEPFDSMNSQSGHLILGFIVMLAFYLHSALWERFKYCNGMLASSYLCLFLLLCFSYFLRFVEGTFRLTIFIALTQVPLELALCTALIGKGKTNGKTIVVVFFASIWAFVLNYLILVPVLFGYPLFKVLSSSVAILLICLITWLVIEVIDSVLFKALCHWINHTFDDHSICDQDLFECSLFPPRCDAAYNFLVLRKEMMERNTRCMSLRKPKNRNVVFQTLKCMVALKRKLNEKRKRSRPARKETECEANNADCDHETNDSDLILSSENAENVNSTEIVNGKLEFNINCNDGNCKCKQE